MSIIKKKFIAIFLSITILFSCIYYPFCQARAFAIFDDIVIASVVCFGLATCGIAVSRSDTDASSALNTAVRYWKNKRDLAISAGLVTGLEINQFFYRAGGGLYDTTSACYEWIKEAAHNIYNNSSYFESSHNEMQVGNTNSTGRILYVDFSDFYISSIGESFTIRGKSSVSSRDLFVSGHVTGMCFMTNIVGNIGVTFISNSFFSVGGASAEFYNGMYYFYTRAKTSTYSYLFNGYVTTSNYVNEYNNISSVGTGISANTGKTATKLWGSDNNFAEQTLKSDSLSSYNVGSSSVSGNLSIPTQQDVLNKTIDDLFDGTLSFPDFLDRTGAIPYVDVESVPGDITIPQIPAIPWNPAIPHDDTRPISLELDDFGNIPDVDDPPRYDNKSKDKTRFNFPLTDIFPFCLPFDLYDIISFFDSEPLAPEFTIPISFFNTLDPNGNFTGVNRSDLLVFSDSGMTFSLSFFDPVMPIFRVVILVSFVVSLVFVSRKLIHGGN